MFLRIQNESLKKECIRVRIRGAFLAKKGAPKLNFHREGGAVAPICPPKSATAVATYFYLEPVTASRNIEIPTHEYNLLGKPSLLLRLFEERSRQDNYTDVLWKKMTCTLPP